ncbi:MAG: peptidyl-prolyl cis-trans isomerase [Lachnospiraceae bacterium]|nr:peptidyl-prolyl cis-trans isomerase [Lachnospiraceae bacterium]
MSNKIIKDAKLNTTASKKKTNPKLLEQTTGTSSSMSVKKVIIAIGIVLVLVACIYVAYDQLKAKVVMTVNNEEVTVNDLGYYIYQAEVEGNNMAMFYAQMGYDYWNQEDENGYTASMTLADDVIAQASKYEIIYQEAVAKGYSVTEEDKTAATEATNTLISGLTAKQKLTTGLAKDEVYNTILKKTVAERYKADVITSLALDYDEITKDITKKDYKQYDFQYYFVSTQTTDEEGNAVDISETEKETLLKRMNELADKAKDAKDFATLLEEGEETIVFNENGQMIEKDGFDEKLDSKIKKMKVDEVSKVLEGETGYYIIKLVDNTSTESYDSAIAEAKETAEQEAFEEEYTNNISPNYTTDVNYDYWDTVEIGGFYF